MAKKKKVKRFRAVTAVKELARERVGEPPAGQVVLEKEEAGEIQTDPGKTAGTGITRAASIGRLIGKSRSRFRSRSMQQHKHLLLTRGRSFPMKQNLRSASPSGSPMCPKQRALRSLRPDK